MNGFYNSIISLLRGIRSSIYTHFTPASRMYTFGTIVSGTYDNWRHDANPTILCLGSYMASNGKNYTHGIQLHDMNAMDLEWLLKTIYMVKRGGQIINPRMFYQFLKINRPSIVKRSYRIYHTGMCKFKMISVGFSTLPDRLCYPIFDKRDGNIGMLNQGIKNIYNITENTASPVQVSYNKEELNNHIVEVMNQKKVFF